MTMPIWTVAEAKSKLSELLRRARAEGPQRIGARDHFVVVSGEEWERRTAEPKPHLGRWLIENMRGAGDLELPDRRDPPRKIPFADDDQ